MASWTLVPALVSLREEFNELAPGRDKASDGSIGDTAHASSSSDHNPDETGATPSEDADSDNEVHAIDVDRDLRRAGWSMNRAVEVIVGRHRSGEDDRLQNVIWNGRIWSRSWGWTARVYTGSNPHDKHAHFSARYTTTQERNTRAWGLLEAEEDDMPTADEVANKVVEKMTEAMRNGNPLEERVGAAPLNYAGGGLPEGLTGASDNFLGYFADMHRKVTKLEQDVATLVAAQEGTGSTGTP